jgi:hypothetical protein
MLGFAYSYYFHNLLFAIKDTLGNLMHEGLVLIIVAMRASRLKINKRKYFPIKIQMPVYYTNNRDEDVSFFGLAFKIRGENENEFRFIAYMGKDILVCPASTDNKVITTNKRARLLKKHFLKNDVVTYLIEIYDINDTDKTIFLLKPQTRGNTLFDNQYPIGLLMYYDDPTLFQNEQETLSYKVLKEIEPVYLKELG